MRCVAGDSSIAPRRSAAWYAIYTRHQHEKAVVQILECKEFETFLPTFEAPRQWKDRTKILSLPLFPCYVFIKANLERRLDIITTPGIIDIVSAGAQPAPIPLSEIESIQRAMASGLQLEQHPFLKCGDLVRVKRGPMAGISGILVRKKSSYRLVLSVEILGKAAAVEIDALWVERVNDDRGSARTLYSAHGPAKFNAAEL